MTYAGFGLAAAIGISGCGASSGGTENTSAESNGTPKESVVAAFQSFEDASNAGFTLTIDSTVEDLEKINAAQPDADQMSASDLDTLEQVLAGSVTMNLSAPDGKTFADSAADSTTTADAQNLLQDPEAFEAAVKDQGAFAASVVLDDSGLFDLVTKDGVFYVRVDADKIAELTDQNLDSATTLLAQLPSSVATPAQKLLDGDWISIDLVATLKALDEQGLLDELDQTDTTAADAAFDQAKLQSLVLSLQTAIEDDAQITETDDGYEISVPYEETADAVEDDLIDLFGKAEVKQFRKDLKEAPSDNFVFDVTVDDGKLTGINVDLVQFLEQDVDATFALDLAIDPEASAVQVPSDATAVDVESLINLAVGVTSQAWATS